MYTITDCSFNQARKYGFIIKLSTSKNKKLDVYKNGIKLGSIGNILYSDYPSYIKTHGLEFAKKRKILYHIRHAKDISVINSI